MIKSALRTLLGLVVGLLVSFALVVGVEAFSSVVHPIPKEFGGTKEEVCLHVAKYPAWVLLVVVAAWGLTALVGTWIAQRLGTVYAAVVLGVLLVALTALNISMLPYPVWFKVAIMVVIPVAAVAGGRLGISKNGAAAVSGSSIQSVSNA